MSTLKQAILLIFLISTSQLCLSDEIRFSSPVNQAVVIELYTSEGCSSCPPAEEHLNDYTRHPDLWKSYIPMAFHVDYWDYLGWKDRFSKSQYSARQRRYARLHRASTVFTPAFFVNGQNWRPGLFRGRQPDKKTSPVGKLEVILAGNQISATFEPVQDVADRLELNIAILGMDISTKIRAGENRGRLSRHEFVVLAHKHTPSNTGNWKTGWPAYRADDDDKLALVAWLSKPGDPTPIQAVGGYIPSELRGLAN